MSLFLVTSIRHIKRLIIVHQTLIWYVLNCFLSLAIATPWVHWGCFRFCLFLCPFCLWSVFQCRFCVFSLVCCESLPVQLIACKDRFLFINFNCFGTILLLYILTSKYVLSIRWQQFSVWNDVMAAVLKLWRRIRNPTMSVDVDLIEEQSNWGTILPNFIQIRFETTEP